MSSELRPCPHCQGTCTINDGWPNKYQYVCECGYHSPIGITTNGAAHEHNNMPRRKDAQELVEALKDAYPFVVCMAAQYQRDHEIKDLHQKHKEIVEKIRAALVKWGK